jgi:hypothetical protein
MSPSTLKIFIEARGGQEKVAREIGCARSELAQVVTGLRENPDVREKLATFFGMTAEQMFDEEFEAIRDFKLKQRSA